MEYADNALVMADGKLLASGSPKDVDPQFDFVPIPAGERLRRALQEKGVAVPNHYVTTREMSQWIIRRLNSNTSV